MRRLTSLFIALLWTWVLFSQSSDYGTRIRNNLYIVKGVDTVWIQQDGSYAHFYTTGSFQFNDSVFFQQPAFGQDAAEADSSSQLATTAWARRTFSSGEIDTTVIAYLDRENVFTEPQSVVGNTPNLVLLDAVSGSRSSIVNQGGSLYLSADENSVAGAPDIIFSIKNVSVGYIDELGDIHLEGTVYVAENYSLPLVDGTANQVIKTNGSGGLSWQDDNGGSDLLPLDNTWTGLNTFEDTVYASGTNYGYVRPEPRSATGRHLDISGGESTTGTGGLLYLHGGEGAVTDGDIYIGYNNSGPLGNVFTVTQAASDSTGKLATTAYVDRAVATGGGGTGQWTPDANGITYSSGRVGIGGASDATYALSVVGTSIFSNSITAGGSILFNSGVNGLISGVGAGGENLDIEANDASGTGGGDLSLRGGQDISGTGGNIYAHGGEGAVDGDMWFGYSDAGTTAIGNVYAKTQTAADSTQKVATTAYVDRAVATGGGGTGQWTPDANGITYSSGRVGIGGASDNIWELQVYDGIRAEGVAAHINANTTSVGSTALLAAQTPSNISYFGAESSTGGSIFSGSTAYATVLGTNNDYPVQFFQNNTLAAQFDDNGVFVTENNIQIGGGTLIFESGTNGLITLSGAGGENLDIEANDASGTGGGDLSLRGGQDISGIGGNLYAHGGEGTTDGDVWLGYSDAGTTPVGDIYTRNLHFGSGSSIWEMESSGTTFTIDYNTTNRLEIGSGQFLIRDPSGGNGLQIASAEVKSYKDFIFRYGSDRTIKVEATGTTNGDGDDLDVLAGNGNGSGDGGNLVLHAGEDGGTGSEGYTYLGCKTTRDQVGQVIVGLPTTDPEILGALWNSSGTVKVSTGPPPRPQAAHLPGINKNDFEKWGLYILLGLVIVLFIKLRKHSLRIDKLESAIANKNS